MAYTCMTATATLVSGPLIWPICRGRHAILTAALLDSEHGLYFAVTHQGCAAPAEHRCKCNLAIDRRIPTLWVTTLSRSDVASKHNIWRVCFSLQSVQYLASRLITATQQADMDESLSRKMIGRGLGCDHAKYNSSIEKMPLNAAIQHNLANCI